MRRYKIKFTQFLPISIKHAWEFFSSASNLEIITPKRLNFEILFIEGENKIHVGQVIGYKVTVAPLTRVYWETLITDVREFHSFTDIQQKGPYSFWSHKHSFSRNGEGVDMTDEIEYEIPMGLLGVIANRVFVARQLKNIFEYRFNVLKEYFKTEK